jgi:hypothetical protein
VDISTSLKYLCYTDPDGDIKGPFLIKNPSTATVYLKVGPKSKSKESRTIDATTGEGDASHFYVKYVRKNGQYFEIFYDDGDNHLYLSAARDDRRDNRSRTLQVGNDSGGAWSYLSLCNEKLKFIKKEPHGWLEGSKAFSISCYVKPAQAAKRDESFLIIRPSTIKGKTRFSICCMSRSMINYSAESDLMQFQLVPVEAPDPPQVEDQQQPQSQQQHGVQQRTEAAPNEGIGPRKFSVAAEITGAS